MYSFKKYDDGSTKVEIVNGPVKGAKTVVVPRTPNIYFILAFIIVVILVIWFRFFWMRLAKFDGEWVLSMNGRNITVYLKTNKWGELIVHSPEIHMIGIPSRNGIVFEYNRAYVEAAASPTLIHSSLFQLKRIQ